MSDGADYVPSSGASAEADGRPKPDLDVDEGNGEREPSWKEHLEDKATELQITKEEPDDQSTLHRRNDADLHASYQANGPFVGVSQLGNVQVMPAQGYWESE